jgi:hypothetical protein
MDPKSIFPTNYKKGERKEGRKKEKKKERKKEAYLCWCFPISHPKPRPCSNLGLFSLSVSLSLPLCPFPPFSAQPAPAPYFTLSDSSYRQIQWKELWV